jgi:hypothetical protein
MMAMKMGTILSRWRYAAITQYAPLIADAAIACDVVTTHRAAVLVAAGLQSFNSEASFTPDE